MVFNGDGEREEELRTRQSPYGDEDEGDDAALPLLLSDVPQLSSTVADRIARAAVAYSAKILPSSQPRDSRAGEGRDDSALLHGACQEGELPRPSWNEARPWLAGHQGRWRAWLAGALTLAVLCSTCWMEWSSAALSGSALFPPSASSAPISASLAADPRESSAAPQLWSDHVLHESAFYHLNRKREVPLSPTHPFAGWDARWNAAASSQFQAYLHALQYTEEYAQSVGHGPAEIRAECGRRRFLVWPQFPYGWFSRVTHHSRAFLLSLPANLTMLVTADEYPSRRGLLDFVLPLSACQELVLQQLHDGSATALEMGGVVAGFLRQPDGAEIELNSSLPWRNWTAVLHSEPFRAHRFFLVGGYDVDVLWFTRYLLDVNMQLPARHALFGAKLAGVEADQLWARFVQHEALRFLTRWQPRVQRLIDDVLSRVPEPQRLLGLQIRRGDKHTEDPYWDRFRHWRPMEDFVLTAQFVQQWRHIDVSHFLLVSDDDDLTRLVGNWTQGERLDVVDVPESATSHSNSFWRNRTAVLCPPLPERLPAYVDSLERYITRVYPELDEDAGSRAALSARIADADGFFAQVHILAVHTAFTLATEGSNIADYIRHMRSAVERNTASWRMAYVTLSQSEAALIRSSGRGAERTQSS